MMAIRQPGRAPTERMRRRTLELEGGDGHQTRERRRQPPAGRQRQRRGKWYLPGFSIDPGSEVLAIGDCIVKTVQT